MHPNHNSSASVLRRWFRLGSVAGVLLAAAIASGQPAGTGAITGRIFNPATGEYLRNAEIRVQETGQLTVSGDGGEFRLSPVPAGTATLVVNYTGYRAAPVRVEVVASATIERDLDLISSLQGDTAAGATVALGAFVVAGEREGNAKAIMDQRRSMNLTNTVASDVFGDNAEGNVGEFLKHLPGVDVEMNFGEIRNVRLRGLDPAYTAVTLDGVTLSSTDPGTGGGADGRAFTFEQVSLSSMDSIEVSKTISADSDANAPAGTINLRTKRAFDRAGRRITVQANAAMHSEELNLSRTPGPGDDRRTLKARPGGILEYSDVFFGKRLGVVLNVSESNVYQEVLAQSLTYNRAPTAVDPRPLVITGIGLTHSPRFNERFSTTLTTDFKATRQLVLSLSLIYNWSDLWMTQQAATFNTGARNTVLGDEPLVRFLTTSAGSVTLAPSRVSKAGQTFTYLPKFEFKLGDLLVEGKFANSISNVWYDPLGRHGSIRNMVSPRANGVIFRAERSSATSTDWKFTQVGGPDLASGRSFTSPEANINDGRRSRAQVYSGEISATLKTNRFLPITWKTGVKTKEETFDFKSELGAIRYNYTGPGGGATGGWAGFPTTLPFDIGAQGERGLELSEEKTKLTSIDDGFDFLGLNIRKYTGTLRIQPAKASVQGLLDKVRLVIDKHTGKSAERLIKVLNPIIRGWAQYYRHSICAQSFYRVDRFIGEALFRWIRRKNPKKSKGWIVGKHFRSPGQRNDAVGRQSLHAEYARNRAGLSGPAE